MIKTDAVTGYLTKKEVCQLLDISPATLNRMLAVNAIPHCKMRCFTGGSYRVLFEQETLLVWLNSRIKPCLN